MNRPSKKIALWFRYGPAEHAELFHAAPLLVERLSRSCEVHYFGMKSKKPIPQLILDHAVIHHLPFTIDRSSNPDKFIKTFLWYLALPMIALKCRFTGIDAVFIDESLPLTALIARLFFGKNTAVVVADFFMDVYFGNIAALTPLRKLVLALDFAAWRRIPVIFTKTENARKFLAGKGVPEYNIHSVPDPCDTSLYHPVDKKTAREQYGFVENEVILAHHGILHPNKGIDLILRALAEAKTDLPNLRFLLVGSGPDEKRLKNLANELDLNNIVTFTGWLPHPSDVNIALNAADIGLVMRVGHKSDDFHLTGALIHSMACGLPVLAAKLAGVSEVITENENGLLFDPSDMSQGHYGKEFLIKLKKLAENRDLRIRLGKNALELSKRLFNPDMIADQITQHLLSGFFETDTMIGRTPLRGNKKQMQAVILAGGLGTRLSKLYPNLPKALAPVMEKPFLLWQLNWLKSKGVSKIHLALGYKSEAIIAWLNQNPVIGLSITTSNEPEPMGTAGGLKFAAYRMNSSGQNIFFALNGDTIIPDLDFEEMQKNHVAYKNDITIAVTRGKFSDRYGSVEFNKNNKVTGFHEKKKDVGSGPGWINAGVYLISDKTLDLIPANRSMSVEKELFPLLVNKQMLSVFPVDGPLLDMGTENGLAELEQWLSTHPDCP